MSINITHKDIADLFERLGIPSDSRGNMEDGSNIYFGKTGSTIASDPTIPYQKFTRNDTSK